MYASMHLALMYATVVSSLPALGDRVHWLVPQDWLQSLGLWDPSVSHSIAPVLILLLLVRCLPCSSYAQSAFNRACSAQFANVSQSKDEV